MAARHALALLVLLAAGAAHAQLERPSGGAARPAPAGLVALSLQHPAAGAQKQPAGGPPQQQQQQQQQQQPAAGAPEPRPAAGGAAAGGGGADKAFKLGCLAPLSGEFAPVGQAIKAAIEMAIDQAAKRAPGVQITLMCEDDKCNEVAAFHAARKLARAGVNAIVGAGCSGASLSAMAVANKFKVPIVSPSSTSTALSVPGNYFFRTVPSDNHQGHFAAAQLLAAGANRTLVIHSDDSYGQSLAMHFTAAYTRDGGEAAPLPLERLQAAAAAAAAAGRGGGMKRALQEVLGRLDASGVYIAVANATAGADVLKALAAADLPRRPSVFVSDSLITPATPLLAGKKSAAGVRGADLWHSPEFEAEFKDYVRSRGGDAPYTGFAATAYDATIALLDAFRRAAPPRGGPELLEQLKHVKFFGKSGLISFDEYGDLKYDPETGYTVGVFGPDGALTQERPGAAPAPQERPGAAAAAATIAAAAAAAAARGQG
ncbi:hypothetical protein Rsub_03428 [Raphidocelis subcapitata]|uniref:Receptor ligand binding region domain-containing protein n=1 Tax=Raphidocelis subcapitata TaxID=307507 RepID=A0A2V0NUT4_9CHLO|nr:hypothetical protein Rsub_03428 [Raphidocelis subcapitata]|eukprot:GBF90432.1 hypothetical protein Rsub_03428 [Raphidocelis subcapitata]